ncbi:SPOR domain-containing protein [Marinomonas sp. 2405UD68-3]|uniref:SPOR domain-containing protein n=1 Tax=Marinomonas sp. 2405UD68-3 TaxID=3391835 RepID=UPI0039C922F3
MKYTRLRTNLCKKLLLLSSITLVACSSAPKVDTDAVDSSQQLANAELKKQVEQQKEEWEAIKPEIERLLALEEDFKLLIQSLNTSQLSNSPQSLGGEVPAVSLAPLTPSPVEEILSTEGKDMQEEPAYIKAQFLDSSTPTKAMKDVSSNKRVLNSNQFAVQVAAYDNEILLAKGWLKLQGSFPELMSSVNPMKESITVKNKNLWALKVGPFASRSLAGNYCSQLKARKQDCFVGIYKGEEL